jgi:hypothetical protein
LASWFAAARSSSSIVITVPPTVAAGRESPDPDAAPAVAVTVDAGGVVSALGLSFFANAGAVTAAVRSRIAVVFESVIGRISHARVARDRLTRRTGPESRILYNRPSGPSNAGFLAALSSAWNRPLALFFGDNASCLLPS